MNGFGLIAAPCGYIGHLSGPGLNFLKQDAQQIDAEALDLRQQDASKMLQVKYLPDLSPLAARWIYSVFFFNQMLLESKNTSNHMRLNDDQRMDL